MRGFFLIIVLSLNFTVILSDSKSNARLKDPPLNHGSHNLLSSNTADSSVNRSVRCTPCENDRGDRRPISNHLNPEYRGNGADNLGYDWTPMAWGGLAFPHRSKMFMGGMRGRDGRMMPDWNKNQGSVHVVCDTCRTYWEENPSSGRGEGDPSGSQFASGGQNFYPGRPGSWQNDRTMPSQDFETRVSSPAVGVLIKPDSRIAYVPSRSGEMYWDGVSGGGTRWDGFSNGISWISNGAPEWDRSDSSTRDDSPGLIHPGGDRPYNPNLNSFRPWDPKGGPGWSDNNKRGYYFAGGPPNPSDPQWGDRGYASNWHYGSTNQFGWNGNNMKWNYGGKHWDDNDKSANRFYFNSPQDRAYGPGGGNQLQYGNQYPNYQPSSGYPGNLRPRPMWRPEGGYRVNDRDPSNFLPGGYGNDKDKPWSYNPGNPSGYPQPGSRPDWIRPTYPSPGDFDKGDTGKHPGSFGGSKYPATDKNDYDKPWHSQSYRPSKPSEGNSYSSGGSYSGNGGRPGNNLFYPNDGNEEPTYPNINQGSVRPTYPSSGHRPGGSYSASDSGPSTSRPDDRPTYTGGRPTTGGSSYPSTESTTRFPGGGSSTGGYPNAGSRPGEYPSLGGYTSSGNRPGSYPSGGRPSGGYSNGDNFGPSSGNPGAYPSQNRPGTSYPNENFPSYFGMMRPDRFPSGSGSFYQEGGGSRPISGSYIHPAGGRPEGYPAGGYPGSAGGGRPEGYPVGGRPTGFTSNRPYPSNEGYGYPGDRPGGYPSSGGGSGFNYEYPGGGGRPSYPTPGRPNYPGSRPGGSYQDGRKPPKGYYQGFITEIKPDDRFSTYGMGYPNYFGGSYPGDKNSYSERDKNRYPYGGSNSNRYSSQEKNPYADDRYSGGGGNGGGSYPVIDRDRYSGYDRGNDRYYYGDNSNRGKYPGGFTSSNRFSNGGSGNGNGEFHGSSDSDRDKNWNYGQNDRKDGSIYRRSGGSYPPYRGGQYYTSSYLASMSTTSGSTQEGSETKTQSVTKADEVTQATPS